MCIPDMTQKPNSKNLAADFCLNGLFCYSAQGALDTPSPRTIQASPGRIFTAFSDLRRRSPCGLTTDQDTMSTGTTPETSDERAQLWRAITGFFIVTGCVLSVGAVLAPSYILAALIGLPAFVLCCSEKRFKYAIFALAAYTPFEEFALKWVPEQLYFYARFGHYGVMGTCLGVILFRRLVDNRPLWIRTPLDLPLALFLVVTVISLAINESPFSALLFSYQPFLRFVILAFFAVQFVDFNQRDVKRLLLLMVAVVMLEGAIGLAQSFIGLPASEFLKPTGQEFMGYEAGGTGQRIYDGYFNIFGTMNRYNTFGAFMGMAIVLGVAFYPRNNESRILLWAFYAVAGAGLLLANARGPWLGTIVAVWVIFAIQGKTKAIVLPLVGSLLLYLALTLFVDQIVYYGWDQATGLQRFLEPFSAEYRKNMANPYGRIYYMTQFPLDMLSYRFSTFLFGFGPGTLGVRPQDIYGLYALTPLGIMREWQFYVVDVNWAYILGQTGILGLAAFVWGLIRIFIPTFRAYRQEKDPFMQQLLLGYIGLFVYLILAACFFPTWEVRPVSLYFWLFTGIVVKMTVNSETEGANRMTNTSAGNSEG